MQHKERKQFVNFCDQSSLCGRLRLKPSLGLSKELCQFSDQWTQEQALVLFKALHREVPSSEVERGRSWLCQSSRRPAYFARSSLAGGLEDPEVMVLLFCVVGIMLVMLVMLMLLAVSVLSLIANLIHVHLVAEVQVGHVGRHHWVPLEVWHPL